MDVQIPAAGGLQGRVDTGTGGSRRPEGGFAQALSAARDQEPGHRSQPAPPPPLQWALSQGADPATATFGQWVRSLRQADGEPLIGQLPWAAYRAGTAAPTGPDPPDAGAPAEPTDAVSPLPAELAEGGIPVMPADPADPTDPINLTDLIHPGGLNDPAGLPDPADPTDLTDPADPTGPIILSDLIGPSGPTDPADPIDLTDPEDVRDRADLAGVTDPESLNHPAGGAGPAGLPEPAGAADPSRSARPVLGPAAWSASVGQGAQEPTQVPAPDATPGFFRRSGAQVGHPEQFPIARPPRAPEAPPTGTTPAGDGPAGPQASAPRPEQAPATPAASHARGPEGNQSASEGPVRGEPSVLFGDRPEPAQAQVGRLIRLMQSSGRTEARMQLHPAELGSVTVRLIMEEGRLRAHLTALDPRVGQLLEAEAEQLRLRLSDRGIQVEEILISPGLPDPRGEGRATSSDPDEQQTGAPSRTGEGPSHPEPGPGIALRPPAWTPPHRGRLVNRLA